MRQARPSCNRAATELQQGRALLASSYEQARPKGLYCSSLYLLQFSIRCMRRVRCICCSSVAALCKMYEARCIVRGITCLIFTTQYEAVLILATQYEALLASSCNRAAAALSCSSCSSVAAQDEVKPGITFLIYSI